MAPIDSGHLNVGSRLTATFVLLIVLILGGNGLVLWEFNRARTQTDRVADANQQTIVVLQLQVNLLSFHQRLVELTRSQDSQRLAAEAEPLRKALYEQMRQTRSALSGLSAVTRVEPAFWPTLEAIEITLPAQLNAITELARLGDWDAVQLRLGNQLKPIETQTGILVESVDRQTRRELAQAVEQMRAIQSRILIFVPATALCSFVVAASFGWSTARRFIELRLEERVTERMRIARELHDTLLQSFHGLLLRFQTASELFPTRPAEAKQTLDSAIDQATQAITEGRDAVQGLRSSTTVTNDLASAITTLGTELAGSESNPNAAEFHVEVEGTPRDLHPILRDEVYRIAGEAMRNAFKHAEARRIEVEIRYDQRRFRLRVRDDGKGIDAKLLNDDERPGHFGLRGMRERAKLLGGKLTVWSEVETGTEVELSIPAANAYATADGRRRSWLAEKFAGKLMEKDTETKS
jgi:signal transduction histidine kinase